MIYTKTVTTPKSTVAATPRITPWEIALGLIYKVEIMYPPGPGGLVGVSMHTASYQLYPNDSDEWFIGDNITISFDDQYLFNQETSQLEIYSYNTDDYYNHTVQVRLGIETDPELIKSRYGFANIDTLITQIQALNSLLVVQNTASGKYSTEVLKTV